MSHILHEIFKIILSILKKRKIHLRQPVFIYNLDHLLITNK